MVTLSYITIGLNNNKLLTDMTFSEIKQDAKNHKGMEMTASTFRYCFNKGIKELNQLVKEDVFEVSGETQDGQKIYKVK